MKGEKAGSKSSDDVRVTHISSTCAGSRGDSRAGDGCAGPGAGGGQLRVPGHPAQLRAPAGLSLPSRCAAGAGAAAGAVAGYRATAADAAPAPTAGSGYRRAAP